VRRMVDFETIDLRAGLQALGPFDVVFCRNILIYFDAPTRKQILEGVRGTLIRGGWLLLGAAETPAGVDQWFQKQEIEGATVYVSR
jgi:chemotaxis protein methyltransferase CheR